MALLTPGFWQDTFNPSGFWHDGFWPDYGAGVLATGKVTIVFTEKQAGITFTEKQAGISFTNKQANITFS